MSRRLIVMLSEPLPHQNKFLDLLASHVPDEIEMRGFSWIRALFGKYDILHLHWPESIYRSSRRGTNAPKHVLGVLLLTRLIVTRKATIWTVHNPYPHEKMSPVDRNLYRRFVDLVGYRVGLTPIPKFETDIIIPHGDYRDIYEESNAERKVPPQILYFGLVRPYKGIERLISAYAQMDEPAATLRVVGKAVADEYAGDVERAAQGVPGVSLSIGHVGDEAVPAEFAAASLVALPYSRLTNSGVLMLALSLGRPVLAPRVPATEEIAATVGSEWVRLYDGELDDAALSGALRQALCLPPGARPNLSSYDWARIGQSYANAYREVYGQRP